MQTFLPFPDFRQCARSLDTQRLGKQRVEGVQIFRTLVGAQQGWSNHPVVLMWSGYEAALALYTLTMCREWRERGYEDNMEPVMAALALEHVDLSERNFMPGWLGFSRLHASHRAALYRKAPSLYNFSDFKRAESEPCCEGCSYYWPTHDNEWRKERAA
jgi:pyrimidine dimer DNA glycosylase